MSVVINIASIENMLSKSAARTRQTNYAMRAALLMRKYVPRDENTLRASEPLNSQYAQGTLIWNTPYAQTQYQIPMHHTTQGTTDHWDEACWRSEGKSLLEYAKSLYAQ